MRYGPKGKELVVWCEAVPGLVRVATRAHVLATSIKWMEIQADW